MKRVPSFNQLSMEDEGYPAHLRSIDDPPPVLFFLGDGPLFNDCIAISGNRNASHQGRRDTRSMARTLARDGYTVVAGFARGVDLEAHLGALDVDGRTIAVLPGAISDIYPREHSRLVDDVTRRGLVLSEVPLSGTLNSQCFIRRNRIISGISSGLIIGESDGTGGTLQQFKIAMKQGRPVFAMRPDGRDYRAMKGFDRFVRDGAVPVDDGEDALTLLERRPMGQVTLGDY